MKREDFIKVAEETLDSLPEEFRSRIQNVAILVEDFPANQRPPQLGQRRRLLLGIFHGVPATKRSVFNLNPARQAIFRELARVVRPSGKVFAAELILKQPLPTETRASETDWFA